MKLEAKKSLESFMTEKNFYLISYFDKESSNLRIEANFF